MASPDTQSVTRLIRAAQEGRASAVGPLLAVYFERLVQLARKRLQGLPGMAGHEEDLALRSFHSVCQRLRDPGRPLHLGGRDDLWRLLELLDEPELRQIALWKVEGYTNEEIAARLDCVPRTVERKVRRIRLLWNHELKGLEP